jgi:dephospho-CoA kinase
VSQSTQTSNIPYIVGLTGGIGSGKSTIARAFAEHGVNIVDTDRIAHQVSASGGAAIESLRDAFGNDAIASDGSMDRDWMRQRVFDNEQERHKLERIVHPIIRQITNEQVMAKPEPYVIIDVPLLIESGNWENRCDRVLVVDCQVQTQIDRVIQRNGFTRERIDSIIAVQATREQRLAAADDVLDNDNELEESLRRVDELHQQYLSLAAQKQS